MIQVNTSVSLRSIFSSMASPDRSTQPSYWVHVWTMHCWYLLMCIKWFVKLKVYIDVIIYRHSPPLMEWHFIPLLFPSRCFCFHWISTQGLLVRISVFKASRPRPNSLSCLWKRLIPSLALTYSDCFPHSYSFFHTFWCLTGQGTIQRSSSSGVGEAASHDFSPCGNISTVYGFHWISVQQCCEGKDV